MEIKFEADKFNDGEKKFLVDLARQWQYAGIECVLIEDMDLYVKVCIKGLREFLENNKNEIYQLFVTLPF
jgi:hypothetical protein